MGGYIKVATTLVLFGALLLLIGIAGGGFKIKEVEMPTVGKLPRILAFILGIVFVVVGFIDYLDNDWLHKIVPSENPSHVEIKVQETEAEQQAKIEAQKREAEQQAKIETQKREAEQQAKIEAQKREAEQQAKIEAQKREAMPMEYNRDRGGSDYDNYPLPEARPELCRDACLNDPNCKAFTYVIPGVFSPKAHCWLKNAVPLAKYNPVCVSGKKLGK